MCANDSVRAVEPTQWNHDCVHGICKECPVPVIDILAEKAKKVISYSLWGYGIDEVKKKKHEAKAKEAITMEIKQGKIKKPDGKVFGLFRHAESIEETVQKFIGMLGKLKVHVYTAYCQWNAHSLNRLGLDDESVITIEDYQENLEIEYSENPTSLAYSSNKTTVELYPIVAEYKLD